MTVYEPAWATCWSLRIERLNTKIKTVIMYILYIKRYHYVSFVRFLYIRLYYDNMLNWNIDLFYRFHIRIYISISFYICSHTTGTCSCQSLEASLTSRRSCKAVSLSVGQCRLQAGWPGRYRGPCTSGFYMTSRLRCQRHRAWDSDGQGLHSCRRVMGRRAQPGTSGSFYLALPGQAGMYRIHTFWYLGQCDPWPEV